MAEAYDVVVVGSGSAGMTAALRASDLGMSVLVLERAHKYGGTSATSGGVAWLPNHGLTPGDTREEALRYLESVSKGPIRRERLEAFVDTSAELAQYLKSLGMQPSVMPWPDYFSEDAAARSDRSVVFPIYDGAKLGEQFPLMREQFSRFKLLNRYTMDFVEAFTISSRAKGWRRTLARVLGRYWTDFGTRRTTRRDRLMSLGGAMIGPMRAVLQARGVEIRLNASVKALLRAGERVSGVEVERFGRRATIEARRGVVVCAGGFEWNQKLRERFLTVAGDTRWSSTPQDGNTGEVLEAALELGAATEFTETGWMVPTMRMPIPGVSNFEETHQAVFDVGRPHSVCINRNGDRFVDEASGYDRFGNAMLDDQAKTGANAPCWHVFDATFRYKFPSGGFMPAAIMPDRKIPPDWWGQYLFKAPTLAELAAQIEVDPAKLARVVQAMNDYARTGVDPEFGRGSTAYDRNFGDPNVTPNPCLGPIGKAPFYAVPINLGDLGTKGGMKADAHARVLDGQDRPIAGLYAAGNAAGSPFGNCYPGAGGTIGPAMVFGYRAANAIAEEKTPEALGAYTHNYA